MTQKGECMQCDQMLELQVAPFYPKVNQKVAKAVFLFNSDIYIMSQKLVNIGQRL